MNALLAPLFLVLGLHSGLEPSSTPSTAASGAPSLAARVSFESTATRLWAGRTHVLHFAVDDAPARDLELRPVLSVGREVIELLGPARVLRGESRGTLRVRAIQPGTQSLRLGDATLEVDVRELPVEACVNRGVPQITAPVNGCVVFGRVSVGVEVPVLGRASDSVRLALSNGEELRPEKVVPADGEATRRYLFDLNAERLPEGLLVMHAIADDRASTPVQVRVVHAKRSRVTSGECEDTLRMKRPEAFGRSAPLAGSGAGASGLRFVVHSSPEPSWTLPLRIEESGTYQFVVVACGERGGGAFPSVGLLVDEPGRVLGTTRLVDRRWHRLPVGPPIELEAGDRTLALRFINELDAGRSDRNLYLDRWELLRVDTGGSGGGMGMMSGGMSMMSGGMMEAGSGAMASRAMPAGARSMATMGVGEAGDGLWVAFERPFDGLVMNGRLLIRAAVNWSGPEDAPAPFTSLFVNGQALFTHQAARPRFAIERAHLGVGEHDVWLESRFPDGRSARTPIQRLSVKAPIEGSRPVDEIYLSVLDERWGASLADVLDGANEEQRQRVARPSELTTSWIELPSELEGETELFVEARGPGRGRNAAKLGLSIEAGGEVTEVDRIDVQHWWNFRHIGTVKLERGPKRLQLAMLPTDARELRVRSVLVRPARDSDRTPPTAELLYPPSGAVVHGVDGVVVEAFDDHELAYADVLIDGRPQASFGTVPQGAGHLFLPLLLRDVAPGEHAISVRVRDKTGNMTDTAEVQVRVSAEPPREAGTYARAVHLLERLAFGPDARELAELLVLGEEAWLRRSLNDAGTGDATARGLSAVRHGDRIAYDGDRLTMTYALRTDNPVRTRFVLFVDDHFSTWSGKTGRPSEWVEHLEYARLGIAPFQELLFASATSPTMLHYLDQQRSYAGRLNENYARELMELHTLGVDGGYTQEEVTALAALLAGLTVSHEAPMTGTGNFLRRVFRFAPDLSDGRPQDILGRRFERRPTADRFDRVREVLELLAGHPSTATFLSRKLVEHYVASPAPEALVEHVAQEFTRTGGDFRDVLFALATHPRFFEAVQPAGRLGPRLTTPLDYGVRLARVCRAPEADWTLGQYLGNAGMGLFDRVTPDGYPDDDGSWADTNDLMQRWRLAQKIPWAVRKLVPDNARRYSGDPDAWRQRMIDTAAVSLTGRLLGEESNAAALAFMEEESGQSWEQVDRLTVLLCRLPEANLK